jgi:DNA-binding transcriptional ArsR family regulator
VNAAADRISDPERVRALAHPLRLTLLDLLDDEGEATATRCAEATGESVASCSFHLRILAKYGYIEPGQRRGREKPWRPINRYRTARPNFDDPASVRAVGALAELVVLGEVERIRTWLAALPREPEPWPDGITVSRSAFWATAEEMNELRQAIESLTDRFSGRWDDPSQRPAGSRPARLFAVLNPDPIDADPVKDAR